MVIAWDKSCLAHPDSILIDDCDENVDKFNDAGGKAILVPQDWNSSYKLFDNNNVAEKVEYIMDELKKFMES